METLNRSTFDSVCMVIPVLPPVPLLTSRFPVPSAFDNQNNEHNEVDDGEGYCDSSGYGDGAHTDG